MHRRHRFRLRAVAALIAGFLLTPAALPVAVAAATGPSITGVVATQGGGTVPQMNVMLERIDGGEATWATQVTSGDDGAFAFPSLTPGATYVLSLADDGGAYQAGYVQSAGAANLTCFSDDARRIVAPASGTVAVTVPAVLGRTITGTLTEADGTPVGGADIWAQGVKDGHWGCQKGSHTRLDGTYRIAGLIPDLEYQLDIWTKAGVIGWLTGDPDDAISNLPRLAKRYIPGTSGLVVNARLDPTTTVSGLVRYSDGSPVSSAIVVSVETEQDDYVWSNTANLSSDGSYVVKGVEPGPHRIRVTDPSNLRRSGYIGLTPESGPTTSDDARVFQIGRNPVEGVNVTLPRVHLPAEQFTLDPGQYEWNGTAMATSTGKVIEVGGGWASTFSLGAGGRLEPGVPLRGGFADRTVYAPGDWNPSGGGIGGNDLITVTPSGRMAFHPSQVGEPVSIGRGWTGLRIIPSSDVDGDQAVDLLVIDSTGRLKLYAGNGAGGFKPPYPQIGHGWTGLDLYAAGDTTGDGNADILALDSGGRLLLYAGRGNGYFFPAQQVGHGWRRYTLAAGADLTGDGISDIVGRNDATGVLYLYRGKGSGYFETPTEIATGW